MTLWASIVDRAGLRDASWRRFVARWLAVSLALMVVAAFQSDGEHFPDGNFIFLKRLFRRPFSRR